MALGSYETALGWLGSENRKSSIRVFFDYKPLCTGKLDVGSVHLTAVKVNPRAVTYPAGVLVLLYICVRTLYNLSNLMKMK